jgi:hypothetical protein
MSRTQTITLDAPQLELGKPEEYLHLIVRLKHYDRSQIPTGVLAAHFFKSIY